MLDDMMSPFFIVRVDASDYRATTAGHELQNQHDEGGNQKQPDECADLVSSH